jgi:hypothetical protein
MAHKGRERASGKRFGEGTMVGIVPTGSEATSEGSSVETEEDIATAREIPPTEEIIKAAEEARRKGRVPSQVPAPPRAPSGGAPEAPEEEHEVPHDKGRMQDIE